MKRVVIDTNILVAALIQPAGFCGRLLDLVVDGAVAACVDDRILAEYEDVLPRRKFHLPAGKRYRTPFGTSLADFSGARLQVFPGQRCEYGEFLCALCVFA